MNSLFAMYAIILAAGVAAFRFFGLDSGLTMNLDRSIFWAINSMTCTGFDASPYGLPEFSHAGIVTVFMLVVSGSLLAMVIGSILVCRYAGLPHSPGRIIACAVFLMLGGSIVGAGFLMSETATFGEAMFEATSAIANAGMNLTGPRSPDDWRVQLVILPLAAIGSLGLPVLIELFDRVILKKPVSAYTRHVLTLSAGVWLIGFVTLFLANDELPWRENAVASWTCAINSRSLGADIPVALSRSAWIVVAVLMLIGAAPGSSAGGMRVTALAMLRKPSSLAGLWIATFLGLAVLLLVMLVAAEPDIATDQMLLIAAGAMGNTGISFEPISMTSRGLTLLSAAMLAGQLLPLRFTDWIVGLTDR